MVSSNFNNKSTNSIVIDVTYKCNSGCKYCQWNRQNKNFPLLNNDDLFINPVTLTNMNTSKVVFSGGEPLLNNNLENIVEYYAIHGIKSILLITNGMLLTTKRVSSLINSGLTGITLSLDGIDEFIGTDVRGLTQKQHQLVLRNFNSVIRNFRNSLTEININTVVSSMNLNKDIMKNLIEFCNELKISQIKFQPVFNDGFVEKKAHWLLLDKTHATKVRTIGEFIVSNCKVKTNSLDFWYTLASILEGNKLKGSSCGLDASQSIAIRGDLKFCFWIDNPIYGKSTEDISIDVINNKREQFKVNKAKCLTGNQCFCLQSINHKWELE